MVCAWADAETGYRRDQNTFVVRVGDGSVELEWVSGSTFRFCRRWGSAAGIGQPIGAEPQEVKVRELPGRLEFSTRYIQVSLERAGGRVVVRSMDGKRLLADAGAPRRTGDVAVLEREWPAGEHFRGLGVKTGVDGVVSPGSAIATDRPFLMSSMGYGEYFRTPGQYLYEFGDRRRVVAPTGREVEYFFYYGPTPKEILEEHVTVAGGIKEFDWKDFRVTTRLPEGAVTVAWPAGSWGGLAEMLRCVMRASYSAIVLPAVDVSAYSDAAEAIRKRAAEVMRFLPVVYSPRRSDSVQELVWLERERLRLTPFLVSYVYEAQERGFPLVRPLAMQYPKDAEAAKYEDEFLLGDELLVAPIFGPQARRRVYLPMGIWTEWHTNRRYSGREVVEIEGAADWIPVFARNGSIVPCGPIEPGEAMAVHYFPRLAAEFFLYEEGSGALTQLHAAPAGDLLRLEVESARGRSYEWVVHHVGRCQKASAGELEYMEAASRDQLTEGRWWYDAKCGNLHIRTRVAAGTDHVIHVSF